MSFFMFLILRQVALYINSLHFLLHRKKLH